MNILQKTGSICALAGALSGCYMLFEPERGPPPVYYPSMRLSHREKIDYVTNALREDKHIGLEISEHLVSLTLIANEFQRELHVRDESERAVFSVIDFDANSRAELVHYSVPDSPLVFRMDCDRDFLLGVDVREYYHTIINTCIENYEMGSLNERTIAAYNEAREKLEAHFTRLTEFR